MQLKFTWGERKAVDQLVMTRIAEGVSHALNAREADTDRDSNEIIGGEYARSRILSYRGGLCQALMKAELGQDAGIDPYAPWCE